MRIVHTVYGMEMGGMEVLVAQLCRVQRQQGHDVVIFAYSKLGVLGEQLRNEGFEVYVPGEAHPVVTILRYFKRFQTLKPDVVHSHGIAPTIHATFGARLLGVPAVLSTRHNLIERHPGNRLAEAQYSLVAYLCHWVTGICETTCMQLRRPPLSWRNTIRTIFNGADSVTGDTGELRKSGLTVLFVGRLMPVKSLHTLIRAFAAAKLRVPDLSLWLVGDGASRAELESLVGELRLQDSVTFWGQTMNVAPFFRSADVFAMSSTSEGVPMALLQGMSVGLPAVTTDVGGMAEVVRIAECGLLAPVGDHAQLSEALVRIATDEFLRKELGEKALSGYGKHFTLERMAENYMKLYRHRDVRETQVDES